MEPKKLDYDDANAEIAHLRAALEDIAEHGMRLRGDEKCYTHLYFSSCISEVREQARLALEPQA